jgi:hypothetical protein
VVGTYLASYVVYRQVNIETASEWSARNNGFALSPYVRALEINNHAVLLLFSPLLEIERDYFKVFVEYKAKRSNYSTQQGDAPEPATNAIPASLSPSVPAR